MNSLTPPHGSAALNGLAIILAGGQSRRFGRDKGSYQWKGRSFSAHIRQIAIESGLTVRVLRRDLVAQCGPLGGLYTGFKRYSGRWMLFLACDMPLVRPSYLAHMVDVFLKNTPSNQALTTQVGENLGFPLILARSALPSIQAQMATRDVSLRTLFKSLPTKTIVPVSSELPHLININHHTDLKLLELKV